MNQPTGGTTVVTRTDAMVAEGSPDLLALTGRGQTTGPSNAPGAPIYTPPTRITTSAGVSRGLTTTGGNSDACAIPVAVEKQCFDRGNHPISCRSRKAVRFVKAPQRTAATGKPGSCHPSRPLTSLHP